MAEAYAHVIVIAVSQRNEAAREVELGRKAESAVWQQVEDRMHEAMAAQRDAELARRVGRWRWRSRPRSAPTRSCKVVQRDASRAVAPYARRPGHWLDTEAVC